ncbi:hypothetical protein R3P38DRAFT_2788230 [Favolaschia claudopus]|uniref:Uncharacterized protein n=1 Tax=Favolaschia claudopus TaxID=2862362 RepID=A0AAW0AME9_9AGAR
MEDTGGCRGRRGRAGGRATREQTAANPRGPHARKAHTGMNIILKLPSAGTVVGRRTCGSGGAGGSGFAPESAKQRDVTFGVGVGTGTDVAPGAAGGAVQAGWADFGVEHSGASYGGVDADSSVVGIEGEGCAAPLATEVGNGKIPSTTALMAHFKLRQAVPKPHQQLRGLPGESQYFLQKEALVITTPAAYPIESGFARRFSVWSAFRKYVEAGFRVHLNEYPRPHICGEDVNCPATLRSSDDAGCRFFAFPEWRYTGESGLPDPTCWTMGGSGCSKGILRRDGAPVNLVMCADRTAWLEAAEAYLSSDVGPMPFGGAPDYIVKRLTSDCFASHRDAHKPVEDPQDADTDFHGKPDCFNELPGETVTEILLHLFACFHIKTVLFKADRSKHCEICVRGRRSIHADTGSRTTPIKRVLVGNESPVDACLFVDRLNRATCVMRFWAYINEAGRTTSPP